MKNRSLISITDYNKEHKQRLFSLAAGFEKEPVQDILRGKVVASLFFEPSTRTRMSFESAVNRLGGQVIGLTDTTSTSVAKGESLRDTIKTVSNYADLIIIRHSLDGSARYASEVAGVPVINAGDGSNQHPTQTLLDMYSILKTQKKLDGLNISLVGDLKYGRTVHSLLMAMSDYQPRFRFVSPDQLKMPQELKWFLDEKSISYSEYAQLDDVLADTDILYMTRVQRERFSDPMEYELVKNAYVLRKEMLDNARDNMKILHPLPRVNEIETSIDETDKAYYFEQMLNGVYIRQAIIASILGLK